MDIAESSLSRIMQSWWDIAKQDDATESTNPPHEINCCPFIKSYIYLTLFLSPWHMKSVYPSNTGIQCFVCLPSVHFVSDCVHPSTCSIGIPLSSSSFMLSASIYQEKVVYTIVVLLFMEFEI